MLITLCVTAGCGEEDMSAPPAEIAQRLAKAKIEAAKQSETDSAKPPGTTVPSQPEVKQDSGELEVGTNETTSVPNPTGAEPEKKGNEDETGGASGETSMVGGKPVQQSEKLTGGLPEPTMADSPPQAASPAASPTEALATADPPPSDNKADVLTASGKTTKEIQEQKDKNSTLMSDTSGLLNDLLSDKDEQDDKKAKGNPLRARVNQVKTRFGRRAIAFRTWLTLQNQMAKRFYVAASPTGHRIAASNGQRMLGVTNTRIEQLNEESGSTVRNGKIPTQRQIIRKVSTENVRCPSGIIKSLELTPDGEVVLIGTEDGRLIARSCADLQNWDIYAQDLKLFQDEYRASSKLSDVAITAIRAIDEEKLLTIDANYKCCVWKISEVVQPPTSPLDLNVDTVRSSEPVSITVAPIFEVTIPKSPVLSLAFSDDQSLAAIVTAGEHVVIFSLKDGNVSGTMTAENLNNTQPVCVCFEQARPCVLIGAADGRLFRRALPGETPIQSMNDDGATVNYEVVMTPDLGDTAGSITALEIKADRSLLSIGRLDGSVTDFDLAKKIPVRSKKIHRGPVISLLSTASGMLSIGEDRFAKLNRIPRQQPQQNPGELSFQLPKDKGLAAEVIIEDPQETEQNKLARRRNVNRNFRDENDESVLTAGIRPADPVLALLEHRLRVSGDEKIRGSIRSEILQHQDRRPDLPQPGTDTSSTAVVPDLVAQIPTELDFQAKSLRPVIMSVTNDGNTISAAQFYQSSSQRGKTPNQPLFIWDSPTKTPLRTWRNLPGLTRVDFVEEHELLLPTPFSARLNLRTGRFTTDLQRDFSVWTISPDGESIVLAMIGQTGLSAPTLRRINLTTGESKDFLEAFEGYVSSIAFSADAESVFVNLRERNQIRLLKLAAKTLTIKAELVKQSVSDSWDVTQGIQPDAAVGASHIMPSPDGETLITYGRHVEGWQLQIWKQKRGEWPTEDVTVIPSRTPMVESKMSTTPFQYVNNENRQLGIVTTTGISTVSLRNGQIAQSLPLPDIDNRRPVALLTSDGQLAIAGDRDGRVYVWKLRSLKAKPRSFMAHSGPVVGLANSSNGRFLATAGEENRIRIWDLNSIDPDRYQADSPGGE